ncbi:MAG: hypothetical protein AB7G75_34990 [Candidatus Binatia bacterium]
MKRRRDRLRNATLCIILWIDQKPDILQFAVAAVVGMMAVVRTLPRKPYGKKNTRKATSEILGVASLL